MPSSGPTPSILKPEEWRLRDATDDGSATIAVLIDAASHGCGLMLGLEWLRPGGEPMEWTADEVTDEVYYVVSGKVAVEVGGERLELGERDAMHLPPSHRYTARNIGDEEALIVWAAVPPDIGSSD